MSVKFKVVYERNKANIVELKEDYLCIFDARTLFGTYEQAEEYASIYMEKLSDLTEDDTYEFKDDAERSFFVTDYIDKNITDGEILGNNILVELSVFHSLDNAYASNCYNKKVVKHIIDKDIIKGSASRKMIDNLIHDVTNLANNKLVD